MVPGTHRPKIIMQTCAHISGAAYCYDKKIILDRIDSVKENETWNNLINKKVISFSIFIL